MTPTLHVPGFEYAPLDLFVFSSGDPEQRRQLMEEGGFAWWTAEGFKMAFWRPLSVATHVLDHCLWERSAVLMHAHSIVWFAVLLAVMAALYRRFHPPWVAGLALMLCASSDWSASSRTRWSRSSGRRPIKPWATGPTSPIHTSPYHFLLAEKSARLLEDGTRHDKPGHGARDLGGADGS